MLPWLESAPTSLVPHSSRATIITSRKPSLCSKQTSWLCWPHRDGLLSYACGFPANDGWGLRIKIVFLIVTNPTTDSVSYVVGVVAHRQPPPHSTNWWACCASSHQALPRGPEQRTLITTSKAKSRHLTSTWRVPSGDYLHCFFL